MTEPATDLRRALHRRWLAAFPELPGVGDAVLARYAEGARVYHDVRHLADVLAALDLLQPRPVRPAAVELAAWFHDAVYDVHRSDNEAASARLAAELLTPQLAATIVEEVGRLVLLTRDHHVSPGDVSGAALCDADLAILGTSPATYDDYAGRVRREFAAVSDADFRRGRADVLRRLLSRPRVFITAYAAEHWESAARANLHRELAAQVANGG